MLLVNTTHQRRGRRKHLIDKDENRLFGRQLDALADDVHELADGEVCGDKVFLLVDRRDIGFLDFFADDLSILSATSCYVFDRNKRREGRTGMRSAYFWRIRSASALRFSKGCSSLNLDRMVAVCVSDANYRESDKGQTCYNVFGRM